MSIIVILFLALVVLTTNHAVRIFMKSKVGVRIAVATSASLLACLGAIELLTLLLAHSIPQWGLPVFALAGASASWSAFYQSVGRVGK